MDPLPFRDEQPDLVAASPRLSGGADADSSSGVRRHVAFADLGRFLKPGDLLVVNTSATLLAAVDEARAGGAQLMVHFSTELDDGTWVVELRTPTGPILDARTAGGHRSSRRLGAGRGRPGDRRRHHGRAGPGIGCAAGLLGRSQ
jgi:hypothetical protein